LRPSRRSKPPERRRAAGAKGRPLPLKGAAAAADISLVAVPSVVPFPSPLGLVPEPALRRVAFIVPAYNEETTILEVLNRIEALDLDRQVIVVDDGSTDSTPSILRDWAETRPWATVVRQRNRGKGAAIRTGLEYVDREIVVIQDADMEYDPAEVPSLIEPIAVGAADVVFGSRLRGGRPQRAHMFWHLVGNRCLSLMTNVLYNTTLSDMETGYKAFRTDVLRSLDLRRSSFTIEPEITAKVCKRKLRVYEMPISYYGRSYAEGKKITWRDGIGAVSVLVAERFRP
jgi:glycosyltransferase involved in cell wall biosynthesis